MATFKDQLRAPSSPGSIPRPRRRSPSQESDRKRHRPNTPSPPPIPRDRSHHHTQRPSWQPDPYDYSRRSNPPVKPNPYSNPRLVPHRYENGFPTNSVPPRLHVVPPPAPINAKSRRLYIGNIPYQAGLTDVALTQFFSALYVAGFRPNRKGEALPVVSFWLHADGKFGFMELRGEQEAVNMMQFNGIFLHGRPLRVNRPSDYRPELHNPSGMSLVPDSVNIQAIMELCSQLGGIVAAPAQLAAIAVAQGGKSNVMTAAGNETNGEQLDLKGEKTNVVDERGGEKRMIVKDAKDEETEIKKEVNGEAKRAVTKKLPCVILLRNLVTDEDLQADEEEWEDLVHDIHGECRSHGDVQDLIIPKSGPWKGSVIVQYARNSDAVHAIDELRQKVFDGRKILSTFVEGCDTAAEATNRPPPS